MCGRNLGADTARSMRDNRIEKADHVTPFSSNARGDSAICGVADHDRDDWMHAGLDREAARGYRFAKIFRVRFEFVRAGSVDALRISSAFKQAATIGGATVLENKYGRERCRRRSTICLRPLVKTAARAAERFGRAFRWMMSIFPSRRDIRESRARSCPQESVGCASSIIVSALCFSAQINDRFQIGRSFRPSKKQPSVAS